MIAPQLKRQLIIHRSLASGFKFGHPNGPNSHPLLLRFGGLQIATRTMSTSCDGHECDGSATVLPKLSPSEERKWNRLSNTMDTFHERFKQEFNRLYELADGSFNNFGWSLSAYLSSAQGLITHLNAHHTIEERYVFPTLAKRLPAFADTPDGAHYNSHRGIHDGLDELTKLVDEYRRDPRSYSPTEMRDCLDGFREVLFIHLDQEVQDLKGDNLRKYFTFEELEPILSL